MTSWCILNIQNQNRTSVLKGFLPAEPSRNQLLSQQSGASESGHSDVKEASDEANSQIVSLHLEQKEL